MTKFQRLRVRGAKVKRFDVVLAGVVVAALGGAGVLLWPGPVESVAPPISPLLLRAPKTFQDGVSADKARSGKWAALRARIIKNHPFCAYCGRTEKLEAHHIKPFHLFPELELEPENIIVLCQAPPMDHHLKVGHKGNFKNWNPDVVADCKANEKRLKRAGRWPQD